MSSDYYVLKITDPCPDCDGYGATTVKVAMGYDRSSEDTPMKCLTCKQTGKKREEVPLREALSDMLASNDLMMRSV